MPRMTRRDFLYSSVAMFAAGRPLQHLWRRRARRLVGGPSRSEEAHLKTLAAARGILYGSAARDSALKDDPQFVAALLAECAMITTESELKWEALRPTRTEFAFGRGDFMVEFAQRHGLAVHGHALVWHIALPDWVNAISAFDASTLLLEHVKTVTSRYAGRVRSWDVVNEAVAPNDGRPDALRNSIWLQRIGPRYIDLAFRTAREADPKAVLQYNDYAIEFDTPEHEAKRVAILRLVERLRKADVPIDAVGIQSHLVDAKFSAAKFRAFIREVAGLGLTVSITELDVIDQQLPAEVVARDSKVAAIYRAYLDAALSEPAVKVVTTWGLTDRYTWLQRSKPRKDGSPVRPLPFDASFGRKPAWVAIAQAFRDARRRVPAKGFAVGR